MQEHELENSRLIVSENDAAAVLDGENLLYLRNTRDAAIRAAQDAVRDTTRLTRLLTILVNQRLSTFFLTVSWPPSRNCSPQISLY